MRHLRSIAMICIAISILLCNTALAEIDSSIDEASKLIQQGLTIYEIDQEMARLSAEQASNSAQIALTEKNIDQQTVLVKETKKHAGKILRAYYMGERNTIWMVLLSVRSISDALVVYDYLSMIIDHDHQILHRYTDATRELQQLQQELIAKQDSLQLVQAKYAAERERQLRLQQDLEAKLAATNQAEQLRKQIELLKEDWKQRGIPVFKSYFQALAAAMQKLPDIMNDNPRNTHLILDGLNYTFQITDSELNEFLRKENPLFNNISFTFKANEITAEGKSEDISLSMSGNYTLVTEPKNMILFRTNKLTFNGYDLDETTYRELEKQFDLSFSPQDIASFISATGVQVQDGKLLVQLKLNF